jgi:hypothetical protein
MEFLRQRCRECGVDDLMEFAGRVPFSQLPDRLRDFDICLSTQSNDVIGNVRTTGKLPLYLAAGKFVLSSRVGEAARVLPPEMLVDFEAETDPDYPRKLAQRVIELTEGGVGPVSLAVSRALARRHFSYDQLAAKVRSVLWGCLVRRRRRSARGGGV